MKPYLLALCVVGLAAGCKQARKEVVYQPNDPYGHAGRCYKKWADYNESWWNARSDGRCYLSDALGPEDEGFYDGTWKPK